MFRHVRLRAREPRGRARHLPWTDDTRFQLGMAVQVGFGYGSKSDTVLIGEVTALSHASAAAGRRP